MDALEATIRKCNLQLMQDNKTEGYGNCFPYAIVQQCRRPNIKAWLQKNNPGAFVSSHCTLRRKVKAFALESPHKTISDFKDNCKTILGNEDRNSWKDYWDKMGETGAWVDSIFVQVTAWYLRLDILILTTSSNIQNPFIRIGGEINNPKKFSLGPPLILGNYTNVHYQSLVPLANFGTSIPIETEIPIKEVDTADSNKDNFVYLHNGRQLTFIRQESEKLLCPFCQEVFQRICNHIGSSKCKISSLKIDQKDFADQINSFREGFRLQIKRQRNQKRREIG